MLHIKNLTVYSSRKKILDNISFNVQKGESLVIVGESGSGKSTLLKLFLGLPLNGLEIESGTIAYEDTIIQPGNRRVMLPFLGRDLVWITQHASLNFNPRHKIKKHYNDLVKNHRQVVSTVRSLEECLELVGLTPREVVDRYPFELSGGMMQLVALALSLVTRPKILLADEPTSALDVLSRQRLINILTALKKKENLSLLLVTHDFSVARQLADKIIVMQKGRIVEEGDKDNVLIAPRNDYTKKLLEAIPKLVLKSNEEIK